MDQIHGFWMISLINIPPIHSTLHTQLSPAPELLMDWLRKRDSDENSVPLGGWVCPHSSVSNLFPQPCYERRWRCKSCTWSEFYMTRVPCTERGWLLVAGALVLGVSFTWEWPQGTERGWLLVAGALAFNSSVVVWPPGRTSSILFVIDILCRAFRPTFTSQKS